MKRATIQNLLAVCCLVILLSSCNKLSLDTYWRSEKYVLIAIDARGQMELDFDNGDGTGTGIIGPTVFSIGADEKYIVVMQHPSKDAFGSFDRTVTNYFVVKRTTSTSSTERQKGVQGPLSKNEFEKLTVTLSLPKFSKTFDDLK